jgi:deferrochelatase/peroxidase EfeB
VRRILAVVPDVDAQRRVSRRALLGASLVGAGLASAAGASRAADPVTVRPDGAASPRGFHGAHQAGIVDPPPAQLALAAFNLVDRTRGGLSEALRTWTEVARELTTRNDSLTVTFGLGGSLFDDERLALADRRPDALRPLPAFARDSLDPHASDGDLAVQVCAGDAAATHQAVRALVNAARPQVALRWRCAGFREVDGTADPPGIFGFRDGTSNLEVADDRITAAHLWVGDGPQWMHGGTYLVFRRIRLLLDTWDRTDLPTQEAMIGRTRDSNVRLDGAATAHVRLAAPERNGGATLLRRGYSYDSGVDPNGLQDAGLLFLCYQRDPVRQFVPVQRRLAADDALNAFSQHQASGLFACPPGCAEDSWIGEGLFS